VQVLLGALPARLPPMTPDEPPPIAVPESVLDRALQLIPRVLSSHAHILGLMALGVFLVLLPVVGVHVDAQWELVGGNYTNVTSDIGACIAAGGTLHLVRQAHRRARIEDERLRLEREVHELLHHVHREAAGRLGHRSPEPER
jgi:hypothetical protein